MANNDNNSDQNNMNKLKTIHFLLSTCYEEVKQKYSTLS